MARDLALVGALVVDGTGKRPRENLTVLLRDGRIASVGNPVVPADAEVIDVAGQTILPGLIDAHTHLSSLKGIPDGLRAYGLVHAMRNLITAGITTVRDLGAYGDSLSRLREIGRAHV